VPEGTAGYEPRAPSERAWARRPWIRGTLLYRFSLDGPGVGAVRVVGGPIDSLSCRERGDRLHVLMAADGRGEAMWDAAWTASSLELASVPTAAFTRGVGGAAAVTYTPLPSRGESGAFHVRFVGDHVLYGWRDTTTFWGEMGAQREAPTRRFLYAHDLVRGRSHAVPLAHDVRRIEAIGRDALVIGGKEDDVLFSAVALGARPAVASTWLRPDAEEGDDRSHGFFYRPTDADGGTLGMPVQPSGPGDDAGAGVVFLSVRNRRLSALGELRAAEMPWREDRCIASCFDWYGDARPLFIGARTFALLGYELVEGSIVGGVLRQVARIDLLAALPPPP
jgi:hypothetical protein